MSTVRLQESWAACLDEGQVLRLLDGTLLESERVEIEVHLDTCEPCRRLVGALATADNTFDAGPDPARSSTQRHARFLGRGASIGRYLVLSLLGAGGMGAVYAAYDPELDRRVAIKLLLTAGGSPRRRALLVREARALGKLSHPNVVQVYDVGEHEGDVFVAMELVAGCTLDAWCRKLPRPGWREVLAAYVDAARGLSAAHAKGIVHRDVKPSNLLHGDDGRARVADFGIAAVDEATPDTAEPALEEVAGGEVGSSGDRWASAKGAVLGTPLYMAPEQHERARVTAASDQYSFCMALYEGLHGRPPFAPEPGSRLEEMLDALLAQKKAGLAPPPPPGSPVPARVHEALVRGLAPDPGRRHPSMEALIAALDVELTEQQEREARLRNLERDQDGARGARTRFVVLSLLGVISATISIFAWFHPQRASIGDLILYMVIMNVVLWVAIAVWHRPLLASQMGRMSTGGTAVIGLAILANRIIALRIGTPVSHVLMVDMGMLTVLLAISGLLVQEWRRIGLALAATCATGVIVTVARPELAVSATSWCSIFIFAGLSYTAYRHAAGR